MNRLPLPSALLLPISLLLLVPSGPGGGRASALPRFALAAGAKCSSCHVNPGGGGMRTRYGLNYGIAALTISSHGGGEDADAAPAFDPRLGESVTLGGDIRTQFLYEPEGTSSSFHMMTAALYADIRFSREVSAYARVDLANAAWGERSGPEVSVTARVLPGGWYVRAGAFLPAYGIRTDDHTAYTRGGDIGTIPGAAGLPGLLFGPNYRDIGMEIGGSTGGLETAVGVFNGTGNAVRIDFRTAKAVVARVEYRTPAGPVNVAVGASGYLFGAYRMGGVHAGVGWEWAAIQGEADFTRHRLSPSGFLLDRSSDAMATSASAEVRLARGVWFTGRYDFFHPARGTAATKFARTTLGLEIFPWPFIEVRPQFRISAETPRVNNNAGLIQLHAWF